MGITLASNFDVNAALPLDSRFVVADITARDAIVSGKRYQGLAVYVVATQKSYQLQGGILNTNWVEFGSGVTAATFVEKFSGNSSTTSFTLANNPLAIENTQVYIDGVYQQKTAAYTLSGSAITFTSAPPTGTNNIEVSYTTPTGTSIIPNNSITNDKILSMDASKLTGTIPSSMLNYQLSASSGTFVHTGNTTITDVTNLSVSITTTGKPVMLSLVSDGSSNYSYLDYIDTQVAVAPEVYFYRGASVISLQAFTLRVGSSAVVNQIALPGSAFSYFDVPTAGTHTYKVSIRLSASTASMSIYRVKLLAREL